MKAFNTKDAEMAAYCAAVLELKGKFDDIELHHVKRSGSIVADSLVRIGTTRD